VNAKVAVVLSSRDPKVLEIGLLYTLNAMKHGWMDGVKLYLFGPAEGAIPADPGLRGMLEKVIEQGGSPVACKWWSDKYSVSELGCKVEYIGETISRAIREGYVPLTW